MAGATCALSSTRAKSRPLTWCSSPRGALAQDLEAGLCRVFHGLQGVAQVPIAPHISGEPASNTTRQHEAFCAGAREHEMMTGVASGLTKGKSAPMPTGILR